MKLYEKIVDGVKHCKPLSKIVIIKDGFQTFNPTEEMVLEDGWIEHIETVSEISEEEHIHNESINEINELKELLSSTDYKIIKCMEAFLCGEELPYDINELHNLREEYRNKINNLSKE